MRRILVNLALHVENRTGQRDEEILLDELPALRALLESAKPQPPATMTRTRAVKKSSEKRK